MDFSRKTAGLVRFRFGFDKKRRFGFLCRSVVKYKKKRVSWRTQLPVLKYCTVLTVLSHGVD